MFQKSILFLGGGRSNIGALIAAKKLGYYTYVMGLPGHNRCYEIADKVIFADIMNKEDVLNAIKNIHIDGALICCSDRAIDIVGAINDKYSLPGISEQSAIMCNNKYLMKKALADAHVSTAKFIQLDLKKDIVGIDDLRFPLMIKAVDLQSSNGIYICKDYEQLQENFNKIKKLSRKEYCIIEEFIEGDEIGAQAFIYKKEVLFVLPHGDKLLKIGNSTVPIIHYAPLKYDESVLRSVEEVVKDAIHTVGFDNCAVNVDLIIKDGVPYILELTGRVGANCLPELVSHYFGINYYDMIVSTAVGDDPLIYFNKVEETDDTVLTRMLTSDISGIIDSIDTSKLKCEYCDIFVGRGDYIHAFRNSNDCIGEILVKARDLKECIELAQYDVDNLGLKI